MLHVHHLQGKGFDGGINEIVNALFGGGYIGIFHGYDVDDGLGNVECFTNLIERALAGTLFAGLYLREGRLGELALFASSSWLMSSFLRIDLIAKPMFMVG
jgi:hypothetical protein